LGTLDEAICRRRGSIPEHSISERLEDYISEDTPVRVIEAFVEELDLRTLGVRNEKAKSYLCAGVVICRSF